MINDENVTKRTVKRNGEHLSKETVMSWNNIPCGLYWENGHVFGVAVDLSNNHVEYYDKTTEDGNAVLHYLGEDVYAAIDEFNKFVRR